MIAALAQATSHGETCALVDAHARFDPVSAARAGVHLRRLVWVRCNGDAGASLKVADLLLHGGGFGMVCLDLADVPVRLMNRLPLSYWHRFRLAVENKPTILLVLTEHNNVKSCAARTLDCRQAGIVWSGSGAGRLLRGLDVEAVPRKPVRSSVCFSLATAESGIAAGS
jgi:hypothetical protein